MPESVRIDQTGRGVGTFRVDQLRRLIMEGKYPDTTDSTDVFERAVERLMEAAERELRENLFGPMEGGHPTPVCSVHQIKLFVDPHTGREVCTECSPRYWA